MEVELTIHHDRVEMELRALRWRRHRLPAPSWLRLRRTVTTLELGRGITVAQADRRGQCVEFVLGVDSIDQIFELAQLRDAVLRGGCIPSP